MVDLVCFPLEVKHTMEKGECSLKDCTTEKELGKQEYIEIIEMRIKKVCDAKQEAERSLRDASSKFPEDQSFDKFKTELEGLFGFKASHKKDNAGTSSNTESGQDNVDINENPLQMVISDRDDSAYPLDTCWDNPKFVAEVEQSVRMEVERSEIRKSLSMSKKIDDSVDPLDFDLGSYE